MADKDSLLVEEQALYEQEQGLIEMEAQLHQQEQGVAQMERAFQKKNKTLLNLASYVADQENNLIARAEGIGPRAKKLVDEMLQGASNETSRAPLDIGSAEERSAMLERRRELMMERMTLVEERETLYARRYESIDRAEGAIADLERKLLAREREISEALRELISQSTELMSDDDDEGGEDDDDEEPGPADGPYGEGGNGASIPRVGNGGGSQHVVEGPSLRGERVRVVGGEVETPEGEAPASAGSRTEEQVTRRRKGRARARTNQFRITLEAHLNSDEPHEFFSYRDDGPDDLPGIFIATPNLLKVGREVRVRVGLGQQMLEATGVVAWRRQRGEGGGPPGMGIELLNLEEADRSTVERWVSNHAPTTV